MAIQKYKIYASVIMCNDIKRHIITHYKQTLKQSALCFCVTILP